MVMERDGKYYAYRVSLMGPEALGDTTGENGERYCVFVRDLSAPVDSVWMWCETLEEAEGVMRTLHPSEERKGE